MIRFCLKSPLRDVVPGEGGTEGGGSAAAAAGAGTAATSTEGAGAAAGAASAPLTTDQLNQILAANNQALAAQFTTALTAALEGLKPAAPAKAAATEEGKGAKPAKPATEGAQAATSATDAATKAEMLALNEKIAALTADNARAKAEAVEASIGRAITEHLATFTFANKDSQEVAFDRIRRAVTRHEDGTLTAGGLPLGAFVQNTMATLSGLLAPRATGGAGAAGGAARSAKTLGLEDIKPGMSKEDYQALASQVIAQLR
jgi:hypothetical protein